MSLTGRKGHEGEVGVRDFINLWYPGHEMGVGGAKIIPSEGMNDRGDIDGVPYTCIEVKNHSNPVVGTLMNNAEWKGANSGRPIWFLVYKRAGFGYQRAGMWHSATSVSCFLSGYKPRLVNEVEPDKLAFAIEDVESLCYDEIDMDVELSARYQFTQPEPEYKWIARLMFRPYKAKVEERRLSDMSQVVGDTNNRVIPIVICPRVGESEDRWYVYTTLGGQIRMLESMGIVPQDATEYNPAIEADAI